MGGSRAKPTSYRAPGQTTSIDVPSTPTSGSRAKPTPFRGPGRTTSIDVASTQRAGGPTRKPSPSRGIGRSRSDDLASMRQSLSRGRSSSPTRALRRGTKGGDPVAPTQQRGRSNSPSRDIGIPKSANFAEVKKPGSFLVPPTRKESLTKSERKGVRGRSSSPTQGRGRARSTSVDLNRGRSITRDPSRERLMGGRSKSRDPSRERMMGGGGPPQRGRSSSPSGRLDRFRSRSRSRSLSHSGRERGPIRKGRKRPNPLRQGTSFRQMITPREDCPTWKIVSYVIPIIILLGSIVGIIIATGNGDKLKPNIFTGVLKNEDIEDPFSQASAVDGAIAKWKTDGKSGLTITVLNAMSPGWQAFFDIAITDWDYGNPDALSISVESVPEEKACTPVNGKIKVCSGDYGGTKWRGITYTTYDDNGFIRTSVAQMNEFFLNPQGDDAKQYTLCHELGHCFGLAHTDEIFGNPDLGNCLDYTENFNVNMHPDVGNYETLIRMYGPIGGGGAGGRKQRRNQERERRRNLRWTNDEKKMESDSEMVTPIHHVLGTVHDVVQRLLFRLDDSNAPEEEGWELLHRSRHGQAYQLELEEEGYTVEVHMLMANNRED